MKMVVILVVTHDVLSVGGLTGATHACVETCTFFLVSNKYSYRAQQTSFIILAGVHFHHDWNLELI